ncbi:MAG: DUF2877 domain-containing protein [Anaerolineae bacterium]|nr:MAG: DUF2877 domain-containing protein [Anaerolineae bacterium]
MKAVEAISLSPAAREWLAEGGEARVLHVFRPACNLVNTEGRVLSLVSPKLGNGPFAAVLDYDDFEHDISAESRVMMQGDRLVLGHLEMYFGGAVNWNPRPDWDTLSKTMRAHTRSGYTQSIEALLAAEAPSDSLAALLFGSSDSPNGSIAGRARSGIEELSEETTRLTGAETLAGLGPGLTPAGDDFLVGFMLAAWYCNPNSAEDFCQPLAAAAAPRTTTLSRAWLGATARGQAGEPWHRFLDTLSGENEADVIAAARAILPTGHTSGADALAGFVFGFERLE